jgi:hypothetical protein
MIAKGNLHGDGAFLARYLAAASKGNERAEIGELRGFMSENIFDAMREIHADAELTHAQKPIFHMQVRTPDGEKLTREQWQTVTDRLEKRLGFTDQPRAIVFHVKDGHEHMHVAWSRIDTENERAIDPGLYKLILKNECRAIEQDMNLIRVCNERDPEKEQTQAPRRNEFDESRRLKTNVKDIRETIRVCWEQSDNGQSFVAALGEHGLKLAQGDRRPFVVIDSKGGHHALGKRIIGLTMPEIKARLADLGILPTIGEVRQQQKSAQGINQQPDNAAASDNGPRGTTQYAIDVLRDLAAGQAASGQVDPAKFEKPVPDDPAATDAERLEAEEAAFWRMKREQEAERERSHGHDPQIRR